MAKGKHSVALFEVIQAGKSSNRANLMRTPNWWFKGKKSEPAASPAPPPDPVAEPTSAPAPRTPGVDLKLDPDRNRIRFDVTYNSVIVAAFTVVVVVGLAYVIGSHMTRGPDAAVAGQSTAQLRGGPPQPGVLKVGGTVPITPPIETNPKIERKDTITPPPAAVSPAPTAAVQPTAPQGKTREAGLNYTVIQSFPAAAKAMAFEVADYLNNNGLPCSVVTDVSGFAGLYVVMGLEGFQRVRDNPAYREYEAKIKGLSVKMAADKTIKDAKYKRFDSPAARRWLNTEKAASPG